MLKTSSCELTLLHLPAAHGSASNIADADCCTNVMQPWILMLGWTTQQMLTLMLTLAGERCSRTGTGADTLILMPMLMLMLMPSLMVMLPMLPMLMLCLSINLCHIIHNPIPNPSTASAPLPPAKQHTPHPPPHQRSLPKTPTRG